LGSLKSVWPALVAGSAVVSVVVSLAASASAGMSARADLAAQTGPWTFEGKADLHDSGALDLKIRSIAGVPRAFDLVRRLLIGRDVLFVNTRVPIVDTRGRAVALNRLNDAILRVKATLLPPGQWRYDLDGEATPTVRVSRILVLSLDPD
jgi:hypothetical protein